MKKKIAIITICILMLIPAVYAFAEDGFISGGATKVEAGKQTGFKIDLEKLDVQEYGSYTIAVSVSPAEPKLWLDVKENVKVDINKLNDTYTLKSEELVDLKAINIVMCPDAGLKETVEYTAHVVVTGVNKVSEEDFVFEAMPKKVKPKKPSSSGGGGEMGGEGGEEPDPDTVYKGSGDNYLKELSVEGCKFTEKFDKTRPVYFLNTGENADSLNVRAIPCDSRTRVDVVGNSNVSAELSKITINLVAENGDVRVYKIYVKHGEAE